MCSENATALGLFLDGVRVVRIPHAFSGDPVAVDVPLLVNSSSLQVVGGSLILGFNPDAPPSVALSVNESESELRINPENRFQGGVRFGEQQLLIKVHSRISSGPSS